MGKRLFSNQEEQYLLSIQYGKSAKECADMMNEKFNLSLKHTQIKDWRYRTKVDSGRAKEGRFTKGRIPHNKGKKYPDMKRNSGMFVKGFTPIHSLPIGSEKMFCDGVTRVKTSNGRWVSKAKILYEEYFDEKVKEDEYILNKDGDKTNFAKDNLLKVSKKELLSINQYNVFSLGNKELLEFVHSIVKLKNVLRDKE